MAHQSGSPIAAFILAGLVMGFIAIAIVTFCMQAFFYRRMRSTRLGTSESFTCRGSGDLYRCKVSNSTYSFKLTPENPVIVDIEADGGTQVGMKLILTPPTPVKKGVV
ncbi:hypothetical protein OF83DRAFT_1171714 [Amylostereum chailletii]|nr:hypothetical protein OF83DRAFT_1171714 [Amylostereum chailletii]